MKMPYDQSISKLPSREADEDALQARLLDGDVVDADAGRHRERADEIRQARIRRRDEIREAVLRLALGLRGLLAKVTSMLGNKGINIEYCYATSTKDADSVAVVLDCSDIDGAIRILKE